MGNYPGFTLPQPGRVRECRGKYRSPQWREAGRIKGIDDRTSRLPESEASGDTHTRYGMEPEIPAQGVEKTRL